ncbi:MAG: AtpZ/AtpI family protein [Candidatus Margulisiibacteriota bacterium]
MNKKEITDISKYLSLLTQVGVTMVLNIVIFLFIGLFLDKWLNTNGIILIIFLLTGIGSGFYCVYKVINEVMASPLNFPKGGLK